MNFCSINEAWGEANKIENKEDDSTEASFKNNIWKPDIFDKNKNNNNKNNKNIETIISEDSSSSKCLSSSSIESFDIIPKKNRKVKNNEYFKNAEIKQKKNKKIKIPKDTISSLATDSFDQISDSSLIETFTESIKDKSKCNKLVNHILKCKKCRDKLRKKFRPPLVKKLNILFDDNKDLLVIILVGFAILIFFKIIFSMCD